MKTRFVIVAEFDDENDDETPLPTKRMVEHAFEHSTAREAITEATGCRVSFDVYDESALRD